VIIPSLLLESCQGIPERQAWLGELPRVVDDVARRWEVTLGDPFQGDDISCSWVARATRADGTPAVLKIGMPHFEGRDEIAGLRFWDGDPTVRLLDADDAANAMLLEYCPGPSLRSRPEPEQDVVIADLLRRLWRRPPARHSFRPLSEMIEFWIAEADTTGNNVDRGLVREGVDAFRSLCAANIEPVVLATDLHAGNVLAAARRPWLAIDPKPFAGDPAYDATQHLLNCQSRLNRDPRGTIVRFADLLAVDADRVRQWLFARAAAGPGHASEQSAALARSLA
jgi:streptomycin 6-kinase